MEKRRCNENKIKPENSAVKKYFKIILAVMFLCFLGKLVFVEGYPSEEEKSLSENLFSMGTEFLNRSWGDVDSDGEANLKFSENESGIKIKFGADENGNELEWFVANRNGDSVRLYCADMVQHGCFNTYSKTLDSIGNYETTKSNNWVTSSIRAFLGRNQGGYPGNMDSRTGMWDACAGERGEFEKRYFTDDMLLKVKPNRVFTLGSDGKEFTSLDRFWLPAVIGGNKEAFGTAISLSPSASFTDNPIDEKINLIPPKYLKGKEFWTRTAFGENALYLKDGQIREALVTESKGYCPVMELMINDVYFISAVQGDKAYSDGVFKIIPSDEKKPYYLKYGPVGRTDVKLAENIETSSQLKIPYYLDEQNGENKKNENERAYLMSFLTNKETGESYFASQTIQKAQNGESIFDLSNVKNGKYEIKSWIEISENENGGIFRTSKVKTSSLQKGYSVTFEEAENIRFLNEKNEDLTGQSVFVSEDKPFRYMAYVEKDYNMSQITNSLTSYDNEDYEILLSPLRVTSANPYARSDSEEIQPLVVGGGIITQGLNSVVYEPREAKNYWEYEISNLSTNVAVRATGARNSNSCGLFLPSETMRVFSDLYIDTKSINLNVVNTGQTFSAGQLIDIKFSPKIGFDISEMTVKLVPSTWIEKIDNNGSGKDIIKESCRKEYDENLEELVFKREGDDYVSNNAKIPSDLNCDVYLFVEGFTAEQYRILFRGSGNDGEIADIYSVGELYLINGRNKTAISNVGYITECGEIINVRYYLKSRYCGKDNAINLTYDSGNKSIKSAPHTDTENGMEYYEWEGITIEGNYMFSLEGIVKRSDPSIYFSDINFAVNDAYEIVVDTSCGTKDKVFYGAVYRFKIRPKEGYEWKENEGLNITTSGEENTVIGNKDDEGYYYVNIYGKGNKGIAEMMTIYLTGVQKISGGGNVYNIGFPDAGNNLKLYRAEESGFTKIHTSILASEFPTVDTPKETSFSFGAGDLNTAVNLDETKKTIEIIEEGDETFYRLTPKLNDLSFALSNVDMDLFFIGDDNEPQTNKQRVKCSAPDLKAKITGDTIEEKKASSISAIVSLSTSDVKNGATGSVTIGSESYSGSIDGSTIQEDICVKMNLTFGDNDSLTGVSFEDISASEDENLKEMNRKLEIKVGTFSFVPNFEETIRNFKPTISDAYKNAAKLGNATLTSSKVIDPPPPPTDTENTETAAQADTEEEESKPARFAGTMAVELDCSSLGTLALSMVHDNLYVENQSVNFSFDMGCEFEGEGTDKVKRWSLSKEIKPMDTDWDNAFEFGTNFEFSATKTITLKVTQTNTGVFEQEQTLNTRNGPLTLMRKMSYSYGSTSQQITITMNIKGKYTISLDSSNNPTITPVSSELSVEDANMAGFGDITVNLLRTVKRDEIISNLNGSGMVAGENTIQLLDSSSDDVDDDSKEALIWVDNEDMKKLTGGMRAVKFSGNVSVQNDYEMNTSTKALNNIFKVSNAKSESKVFVTSKNRNIIKIAGDMNIDLGNMTEIKGKEYNGSNIPAEMDAINISEPDKLSVSSGNNFKLEITVTSEYEGKDMVVSCKTDNNANKTITKKDDESTADKKVFIIEGIDKDINIKISNIKIKKFNITYPTIEGIKICDLWGNSTEDKSGKSYVINSHDSSSVTIRQINEISEKIFPENEDGEYGFMKLTEATKENGEIINIADFEDGNLIGYTVIINNVTGDLALEVSEPDKFLPVDKTYEVIFNYPDSVNFNWVEGVNSRAIKSDKLEVISGTTLKFTVDKLEGCSYEGITVYGTEGEMVPQTETINGETKEVYTINDIKRDEGILVKVKGEVTRIKNYIKFDWLNPDEMVGQPLDGAVKVELPDREDNFVNCGVPVYFGDDVTFYVTVLDRYSQSADAMELTKLSSDIDFTKDLLQSDYSKRKFAYTTSGGIRSEEKIGISRISPNISEIEFKVSNGIGAVYDLSNDSEITTIKKELYEGETFKFYIEKDDIYEIESVEPISLDLTGYHEYNKLSELKKEDAGGIENAYIIENLFGGVYIKVTLKYKVYEILFKEGEQEGLQGDDIDVDKFNIKSVSGNQTELIDKKRIMAPHGEEITITLEFNERFDKFDAGKTNNANVSGIGSITLEHIDKGEIGRMIKDRNSNELQITAVFKEKNTVELNYFEVNSYSIDFPEDPKGYTIHASVDGKPGGQITESSPQSVKDGNTYEFYIRPLGGGFSPSTSAVTLVTSNGERITLTADRDTMDQEYILYKTPEIYRDVTIEVESKKQKFDVKHEGYNVSFYYPVYKSTGEMLYSLETYGNKAPDKVESGASWIFYVKANKGYDISELTAKTNTGKEIIDRGMVSGIPAEDDEPGYNEYRKFEIDSINLDTTVSVDNIKIKEYQIRFELDQTMGLSENLKDLITVYDDSGNKFSWDSLNKVLYGKAEHFSKFRFKVIINEAYSKSNLTFTPRTENSEITGETIDENGEYWEISESLINKGYDLIITVSGFQRNKYFVTFEGKGIIFDDNKGVVISSWDEFNQVQVPNENNKKEILHETGEIVFRVKENTEDGYSIDGNLEVRATNGSISSSYREGTTSDGKKYKEYTLLNVVSDTTVNVSGAKSMFYTINFKSDLNESTDGADVPPVGLKILDTEGRNISSGIRTTNGSNVKFSIVMDTEYTQLTPQVYTGWGTAQQIEILNVGGYYTVENVKKNETVTIRKLEGNKNTYTVSFLTDGDFSKVEFVFQSENKSVVHGGNYSFKIRPKTGYGLSEAVVTATNCEIVYSLNDNNDLQVSLLNVIATPEVLVNNVTLNLYNVKFNISAVAGETLDSGAAIVRAYGSDRNITEGTYVNYQEDLEFKIELSEGYSNSSVAVEYKQGDEVKFTSITPNGDYYKIANIVGGITVNIGGLKKNQYSVRLVMNAVDASNVVLSQGTNGLQANTILQNVVKYGESYSFSITAKTGYNLNKLTVTTRDADVSLELSADGSSCKVTLANVKGDLNSVNISGINKNLFLVSFPDIENISVYDDYGKEITTTGKEVAYQGSVRFTLEPHEGYDQKKGKWVVQYGGGIINSALNEAGKDSWTVRNIMEDVEIKVTNVEINTYEVKMKGNNVTFCNSVTDVPIVQGKENIVQHNGRYTFKVKADTGWDLSNMHIESDVGDLSEESRGDKEAIYTLENIKKDATVNVRIDQSKIELTFIPGTGIIYQEKEGISEITGKQTVTYGNTFEFIVKALPGYDINTLKVKMGEEELRFKEGTDEYRKFAPENLTQDYEISTSIEKKKYTVTVPVVDGVSFYENNEQIKGGDFITVRYGDRFRFRVVLDEKHNQSSIVVKSNIKRQENGQQTTLSTVLSAIDGFYTITEISDNITISVENVEVNRYKVNLVEGVGIQYMNSGGGQTDIKGIHVVEYGESFSFKVSPLEGYELSKMVVNVQGENGNTSSITPSGGVYSITNIKENKTVTVRDQAVVQYKVTFAPADGVTYMNDTGNNIKDPILVNHGNNFEFSISIADAYDESIPMLEASSSKSQISKMSTGRYMLTNVVEDMTIKTLNVSKNRYTVTLKEVTGVIYKSMDGRILTGDQSVEHEGSFQFRVDLHQAYNESIITAMLGNEKIKPESDGSFLITGIMENKTVTVTGVEENPEVKLINMINALRDEIKDATDVDAVVEATKFYNQLSDAQKARVTNLDKLLKLQKEAGTFIHSTNDITVEGTDWYIKLVAIPLSPSSDEMGRIYGKLNTEFVLSLYNIYLWNMMTEKKYELPEGQKVKVAIPTPDLKYFKDTFIVHEKSDGKLEYLPLTHEKGMTLFEMTSFSPVGMAAKRKVDDAHSSFFDAVGTNINEVKKIISSVFKFGNSSSDSQEEEPETEESKTPSGIFDFGNENIDEKFKQGNGGLSRDSALRLLIILALGLIISIVITLFVNKRKSGSEDPNKFEIVEHETFKQDQENQADLPPEKDDSTDDDSHDEK